MRPGLIQAITPSDTVPVEGVSTLLIAAAGDLAIKGRQPGAPTITLVGLTVGQQIYWPETGFVMATGTTATVAGIG